jgi:hypothetical protein
MTVEELIAELSKIENKQMVVTIYNAEYSACYELEEVRFESRRNGEPIVVLEA